jgi:hypothetical protein
MQYFDLLQESAQSHPSTYLTDTVLPEGVAAYAVLSNDTVSLSKSSNKFYNAKKIELAQHLGSNKTEIVWCQGNDCNLGLPVNKARWTAGVIAGFLHG